MERGIFCYFLSFFLDFSASTDKSFLKKCHFWAKLSKIRGIFPSIFFQILPIKIHFFFVKFTVSRTSFTVWGQPFHFFHWGYPPRFFWFHMGIMWEIKRRELGRCLPCVQPPKSRKNERCLGRTLRPPFRNREQHPTFCHFFCKNFAKKFQKPWLLTILGQNPFSGVLYKTPIFCKNASFVQFSQFWENCENCQFC